MSHKTTPHAAINWRPNGVPEAPLYGDVYFSVEDGVAESRYVFLEGNKLPQRWKNPQDKFHIAELGFGTGLNFLLAWQLWQQSGQKGILHYTSAEKYPLTLDDMKQAHSHWPELSALSRQLQAAYHPAKNGFTTVMLAGAELTLWTGEAFDMLRAMEGPVDAWFLDGFAPAKNPDMWQPQLFDEMAAHSRPGTTLATFTAAGQVRRDLASAGFDVEKAPGYGRKRHMVVGRV